MHRPRWQIRKTSPGVHGDRAQAASSAECAVGDAPHVLLAWAHVVRPTPRTINSAPGAGVEDDPALGLSVRLVLDTLGVGVVGMNLNGQRRARVDELREYREAPGGIERADERRLPEPGSQGAATAAAGVRSAELAGFSSQHSHDSPIDSSSRPGFPNCLTSASPPQISGTSLGSTANGTRARSAERGAVSMRRRFAPASRIACLGASASAVKVRREGISRASICSRNCFWPTIEGDSPRPRSPPTSPFSTAPTPPPRRTTRAPRT